MNHREHMYVLINELFAKESPKAVGDGPTPEPAFTCQVRLRSGYQAEGVLGKHTITETRTLKEIGSPEYTTEVMLESLKFASVGLMPDPQFPQNRALATKIIAEHYFDYEDVETIIVLRKVDPKTAEREAPPKIITSIG